MLVSKALFEKIFIYLFHKISLNDQQKIDYQTIYHNKTLTSFQKLCKINNALAIDILLLGQLFCRAHDNINDYNSLTNLSLKIDEFIKKYDSDILIMINEDINNNNKI